MGAMKEHYMTLAYELTSQLTQGCVFELQAVLDEFENAFNNDWLDIDWLPDTDEITLYDVAYYCVITGATLDSLLIEEFLKSCNLPVNGLYRRTERHFAELKKLKNQIDSIRKERRAEDV